MTPPRSLTAETAAEVGTSRIKPRNDNAVVALDRALGETTAGGIIIPAAVSGQDAQGRNMKRGLVVGTVLAAGPGHYSRKDWFIPSHIRPGMRVWIGSDAGDRLDGLAEGERECRMVRAEEIVMVEEPAAP